MSNIEAHEEKLNRIITDGIKDMPGVEIIGPADPKLRAGIVSFTVDMPHGDAHDIALVLDETKNIEVRSGAFCVHS